MKKFTYTNNMPYTYDPTHARAHYNINGKYANRGEFCESVAKFHRGLEYVSNPATSYDEGSDIESLNASVKSSGASLACVYGDFDSILRTYFANVHSTLWIYITIIDENVIEYHMNKEEFKNFVIEFGTLAKESGSDLTKIRFKKESQKMLKWFEDQI